jgi:hypothetical protein
MTFFYYCSNECIRVIYEYFKRGKDNSQGRAFPIHRQAIFILWYRNKEQKCLGDKFELQPSQFQPSLSIINGLSLGYK